MRPVFFLLFALPLWPTYGQGSSPYSLALAEHIEYKKEIEQKVFGRELDSLLVELNDQSAELPKAFGRVRIVLVNKDKVYSLTSKNQRIFLVDIRPAKVGPHSIVINVIDFSVTRNGKRFNYLNGGGSILEYKYNCAIDQFELTAKKQGGI